MPPASPKFKSPPPPVQYSTPENTYSGQQAVTARDPQVSVPGQQLNEESPQPEPTLSQTGIFETQAKSAHPLDERPLSQNIVSERELTKNLPVLIAGAIEIANWDELVLDAKNAKSVETISSTETAILQAVKVLLQQKLAANRSRHGSDIKIMQFAKTPHRWQIQIKTVPSLLHGVQAGIDFILEIIGNPLGVDGHQLAIKAGLDLLMPDDVLLSAAVLECSVALPQTLTLSGRAFQIVQYGYNAEPIGPFTIGQKQKIFYRLKPPLVMPEPEHSESDPHEICEARQAETVTVSHLPDAFSETENTNPLIEDTTENTLDQDSLRVLQEVTQPLETLPPQQPVDNNSLDSLPADVQQQKQTLVQTFVEKDSKHISVPPEMSEMNQELNQEVSQMEETLSPKTKIHNSLQKNSSTSEITADPNSEALSQDLDQDQSPHSPQAQAAYLQPVDLQTEDASEEAPKNMETTDSNSGKASLVQQPVSQTVPPKPEAGTRVKPADLSFLDYRPPELFENSNTRPANLSYQETVNSLSLTFQDFLTTAETALSDGGTVTGKLIFLLGEPGIGKSSIIQIARSAVDAENARASWIGGHAYQAYQHLPMQLWLDLIQNLINLSFEGQIRSDVEQNIQRLLNHVYNEAPSESIEGFIKNFLMVTPLSPLADGEKPDLDQAAGFFFHFLTQVATKKPVVIILEDLMHADRASLKLLSTLLNEKILEKPITIIATAPPDFQPKADLQEAIQQNQLIELVISKLSDVDTEKFLDEGPFGGKFGDLPRPVAEKIVDSAGGNTFLLEEVVRYLHLNDILAVDQETGKFIPGETDNFSDLDISHEVKTLIKSRFLGLNKETLHILQLACVIGERFSLPLLFTLSQLEQEHFNSTVTVLFNQGFFLPDGTHTGRFRHTLIWQSVYQNIEPPQRENLHQLVGKTLENSFEEGFTVNPMIIAYHADCAKQFEQALEFWNLGGVFAQRIGAIQSMTSVMLYGLNAFYSHQALSKGSDLQSVTVLAQNPVALKTVETIALFNQTQNPDLSITMLQWLLTVREKNTDPLAKIEITGFLANAYEAKGNISEALEVLEKTQTLIEADEHPHAFLTIGMNRVEYTITLGKNQTAQELLENEIKPVLFAQPDYQVPGTAFNDFFLQWHYCKAQLAQQNLGKADVMLASEAVDLIEKNPGQSINSAISTMLWLVHSFGLLRQGRYEECNKQADMLLETIESMESADWFLAQWGLMAIQYHCEFEEWQNASQLILTVLSKSDACKDHYTNILAQAYAGHIASKLGKQQEAQQLLEKAIERSAEHKFANTALFAWRMLALFDLNQKNYDLAYDLVCKALDVAEKPTINNDYEQIKLTLIAARALLAMAPGNKIYIKQAGKLLEKLWPRVNSSTLKPLIAETATEIGGLYKTMAQEVSSSAEAQEKQQSKSIDFYLQAKRLWLDMGNSARAQAVDALMPA
ncbi:MAG: AAA family ATPase [Cyanobacteria bacterium P01_H01_bin.74]